MRELIYWQEETLFFFFVPERFAQPHVAMQLRQINDLIGPRGV